MNPDPNGPTSLPKAPSDPVLTPITLVVTLALGLLLMIHPINDSDLGFHLNAGRWIVQHHQAPRLDTFTDAFPGRRYIDMEWLYQSGLYLGHRLGGYSLLALGHWALILAALILAWRRSVLAGAPPMAAALVLAWTVLACEARFRLRPEVLTWVLMGAMIAVLEVRARRGRNLLFLLPLLQLIWVNTEGLFFIGPVLMASYCATSFLKDPKPDKELLRTSGLAAALCLLNPYFLEGVLFPFSFLSSLGSSDLYRRTVQEFRSPWAPADPAHPSLPLHLLAYRSFFIAYVLLFLSSFRSRRPHEWILSIFFMGLSVTAMRNVPLFLLACAPWAAVYWQEAPDRWPWQGLKRGLSRSWLGGAAVLALVGLCLRVATGAFYISEGRTERLGLGLDQDHLPVRAAGFLVQNSLEGRVLNSLDAGNWLEWQWGRPVHLDNRLDVMGPDRYREYLESQRPGGFSFLLTKYRPDILFFDPLLTPQWMMDLTTMPEWRLVALDPCTAVFLRKGYADQVPSLDPTGLPAAYGIAPGSKDEGSALLRRAPPSSLALFLRGFYHPPPFPNHLLDLGVACGYGGRSGEAETFFLEAIRLSEGAYSEPFYDLGLLYHYTGKSAEAALCMERVLKEKPGDTVARQLTGNSAP